MKNFQKTFLKILVITALFICFYNPVIAQTGDYTVLTPLPGIGSTPALPDYLSGMFKLAIAISAVLAFAMITWGGITYATSDAMSKTEKGKQYIENAIYGLILVIGAWVILNTINPNILKFNLNFDIKSFGTAVTPTVTTATGKYSTVVNGTTVYYSDCSNCKTLSSLNISTVGAGSNPMVEGNFATELSLLDTTMKSSNIDWIITEAYPPTVNHKNECHQIGTCVDARPKDRTAINIQAMADAAKKAGITPVYEVATQKEKDDLIKAGVTTRIDVVSWVTGPHFSLYK